MGGMIDLLVNGTGTVEHVGRKQVIYPDAFLTHSRTSLVAQAVKNLPGRDLPLEKGTTAHSSILAGESHGQRGLARSQRVAVFVTRVTESDTSEQLTLLFSLYC